MNLLEKLEATAIDYQTKLDEIRGVIIVLKKLNIISVNEVKIKKKKKRKMSAKNRAAISKRMKAYWAGRRKE